MDPNKTLVAFNLVLFSGKNVRILFWRRVVIKRRGLLVYFYTYPFVLSTIHTGIGQWRINKQGSKGIGQLPKTWCSSTMVILKICHSIDYNKWLKRLDFHLNERTNKKVLRQRIRNCFYKTGEGYQGLHINFTFMVPPLPENLWEEKKTFSDKSMA